MVHYRKILELYDEGISLRGISASTGHSRQKVTEIIQLAEKKGLMCPLDEEIDTVIGEYIHPSALLCTDTATNYNKFAKIKGLHHEIVNERQKQRVKKGIYHIWNVNNFHGRLKTWMERFQGVATQYLDNYLFWFRWLEVGKKLAFKIELNKCLFRRVKNQTMLLLKGLEVHKKDLIQGLN